MMWDECAREHDKTKAGRRRVMYALLGAQVGEFRIGTNHPDETCLHA